MYIDTRSTGKWRDGSCVYYVIQRLSDYCRLGRKKNHILWTRLFRNAPFYQTLSLLYREKSVPDQYENGRTSRFSRRASVLPLCPWLPSESCTAMAPYLVCQKSPDQCIRLPVPGIRDGESDSYSNRIVFLETYVELEVSRVLARISSLVH